MILRIIIGAAGQLGAAITSAATRIDGRTIAIDPLIEDPPAGAEGLRADVAEPEFDECLAAALPGASRAELILAAGLVPPLRHLPDTSPADIHDALADVVTSYHVMSVYAERLREAGLSGSIVIISSVGARHAHRYMAGYDAARAGMESLARSFALEYGASGITTRALAVGPIAESATSQADGDLADALIRLVPLGRYPRLDEIAAAALAFASPAFDCANGQTIAVDGGLTIQLRPRDIERNPPQTGHERKSA